MSAEHKVKRLIPIFIVPCIVAGCNTTTEPGHSLNNGCLEWDTSNMTDPFELLVKSRCFRTNGAGYTGETAPEEIALCKLMKRENASDVLEELYIKGRTAGKLYALVGLHIADKAKFNKLAPELREDSSMVDTQGGCIVYIDKVQDIVEAIDGGLYDEEILRELKSDM